MERLKHMKETLMTAIEGQLAHLDCVDAHELGEVVDMLKDTEEAMYYCSIVKAMEDSEENTKLTNAISNMASLSNYRDMDRDYGRMYYDERYSRPYVRNPMTVYDVDYTRDAREGRSPRVRKSYMESKELHRDKTTQMQELDRYAQELATDITEMISDATPEEKAVLQQKLVALANKIK